MSSRCRPPRAPSSDHRQPAVSPRWPQAARLGLGGDGTTIGTESGLPIPRFVSLKSDRVNLREGPAKDHRTTWVFQRAGLPVEITAEFETWRRIRDSEGAEGWVLHSLLSGTAHGARRALGEGGPLPLYASANVQSGVVAQLQPGVLGSVKQLPRAAGAASPARASTAGCSRTNLWGVYPNEKID